MPAWAGSRERHVDMAEASSRLSQAQLALQASANIFSSLQKTSLLNYLPPA